jgi:cytochrome c peroxidase
MKLINRYFNTSLITATFCLVSFIGDMRPVQQIKGVFDKDTETFKKDFQDLRPLILALDSTQPNTTTALQEGFKKARISFKKIEFIVDHLSPEYTKYYLNGPPLPHLARSVAGVEIEEPIGLQVLEELIFSGKPASSKSQLLKSHHDILENMSALDYVSKGNLSDRQVFEALRFGIVRLFALGLTGFDTPASPYAMEESIAALKAMHNALMAYASPQQKVQPQNVKKIQSLYKSATAYLVKNQSSENFDHLFFLRQYVDPLYGALLDFHLKTGIETMYETSSGKKPVNYLEKHIFSKNFINRYYFTSLKDDQSNEKLVNLGKTLFFDPVLSSGNERSCASCHQPQKAFTDGKAKSIATNYQGTVDRNAPTLIDAAYAARQFWDMRANRLEEQAEHVVVSEKEFHTDYYQIMEKLGKSTEYQTLFANIFKEKDPINKDNFSTALAAYVASLASFNSPFDRYVGNEVSEISPSIKRGFNLFMGKAACGTCHFAPVFNGLVPPHYNDSEAEVLGVPKDKTMKEIDSDPGKAEGQMKERSPIFIHAFKTPTVRNIALTAPYMHNGVFDTLEEVMDFYNNGGGAGHGLAVHNQTLSSDSLKLSKQEIKDIIVFMQSLTDTTGLTSVPKRLPVFEGNEVLNKRKIGGEY